WRSPPRSVRRYFQMSRPWRKPECPASKRCCTMALSRPLARPRRLLPSLMPLREAVIAPDTKERMAADGTEPLPSTSEQYAADIDKEETKWSAIVRKAGAKAQ